MRLASLLCAVLSCTLSSIEARAQAVPLTRAAAVKYGSLSDPSRKAADRLFYLMLYEQNKDLRGALLEAATLSNSKARDVKSYRKFFRSSWLRTYINPSRVMIVPRLPDKPEMIASGDWTYKRLLDRLLREKFNQTTTVNDDLSFLTTAADLLPMTKNPAFQSVIKAAKLALPDGRSGRRLFTKQEISEFYDAAIEVEMRANTDPHLKQSIRSFIETVYGSKLTELEVIAEGASRSNTRPTASARSADAELKLRQDDAIDKIKNLIETQTVKASPEPTEPDHAPANYANTFEYKLGELEGGASIAINILQFSDPESARRVSSYVNAGSQVARLYNSYIIGEIGPWAFAGGYFTIALAVVNSIQEGAEKAATMSMLQDIAKSITSLHKDMLTSFEVVNARFDDIMALDITSFARIEDALIRVNQIASQGVEASQRLESGIATAKIDLAHSEYRRSREDTVKYIDDRCAFIAPNADSSKKRECIRTIMVVLLLNSRYVSQSGLAVLEAGHYPYLFEHFRYSDAYLSAELVKHYGEPGKLVIYGSGKVVVPAGVPDLVTWLAAIARLRWEVEVNGLPLSSADRAALDSVAEDGRALSAALRKLGEDSTQTWGRYIDGRNTLEAGIRDAIDRYRLVNIDGLLMDAVTFCRTCLPVSALDTPRDELRMAKERSNHRDGMASIFQYRKFLSGIANSTHVTKISDDPKSVIFANQVKEHENVVSYASLPKKLQSRLGLEDIIPLADSGVVELSAIISDVRHNDSEQINDKCGPIQGGSRCADGAFLTARIRILATTAPLPTEDQIIDALNKAGAGLTKLQDFSSSFPYQRTFDLFDSDLRIATPYPTDGDGRTITFHRPDWPQIMAYIYRDLDRDDLKINSRPGLQVLRNDIARADQKGIEMMQDIYRAISTGLSSPESIPEFSYLQRPDVLRLRDLAAAAQDSFSRAAFISATDVSPSRRLVEWNAACRITGSTIPGVLDNRWWLQLPYTLQGDHDGLQGPDRYFLSSPDPTEPSCHRREFVKPTPTVAGLVEEWSSWADRRSGADGIP